MSTTGLLHQPFKTVFGVVELKSCYDLLQTTGKMMRFTKNVRGHHASLQEETRSVKYFSEQYESWRRAFALKGKFVFITIFPVMFSDAKILAHFFLNH